MVDSKWAEFWWTNITGATLVVTKVTSAIFKNKMVVLEVPMDLPWRAQLRTTIQYEFREYEGSEEIAIHVIDDADDCGDSSPGEYILKRFAQSREVLYGYRTSARKTIQEYIKNNKVLRKTIIWIKGLDKRRAKEWLDFCQGFETYSFEEGFFVLEIKDASGNRTFENEERIRYSDYFTGYDIQLFNSLVLDKNKYYSDIWRRYISTVSACLCETDPEISVELISCVNWTSEEPILGLQRIEENGEFSRRGEDKNSKHILAYYRKNDLNEIQKRIWSAQLQVLYPQIEMERVKFINTFYDAVLYTLENRRIFQYGEVLTSPNDVEIGTLDFLVKNHKVEIPAEVDREWVSFLHYCRNVIAHMNCLLVEDVVRLLK